MNSRDRFRLEGAIESWVADRVADHITTYGGSTFHGTSLRWSDHMPDDDPHADFMVVDSDGIEYVLDVEVFLHPKQLPPAAPPEDERQQPLWERQ